jgi:hypothetical protein
VGFIAGLSIFFEQKSKRAELAMFVLPKAIMSVYMILIDRRILVDLPFIEVGFSSMAMGLLMSNYQTEPEHIHGLVLKLLQVTLGKY